MSSEAFSGLVTVAVVAGAGVLTLPLTVALVRDVEGKRDIVLLVVLLGWTVLAWGCALILALTRPRRDRVIARPVIAPRRPLTPNAPCEAYSDGMYLVSAGTESNTWAVRSCGEWRIVYEVGGVERLVGLVGETDVPLSVLADALRRTVS
jgi:hypothetical protein